MNAAWEILRPMAGDEVMAIVKARLLQGLKFFEGNKRLEANSRENVKLALLIVRLANPTEDFTDNEKALMNCPARGSQQKVEESKPEIRARKRTLRARS